MHTFKPLLKLFLTAWIMANFVVTTVFGESHMTSAMEIVKRAKKECTSFDDGEFHMTDMAITTHDLTGDGNQEKFVDASQFSCSTSASMWNGSGGAYLWVIVEGKEYEFLANKWRVVDFDGQKVLLLAVHSSECSNSVGPCYRALVWNNEFRTTR